MKLATINNDKDFEHFCKWIARDIYGPNVFLYDRHSQKGIDIYWINNGEYHVIQCKKRKIPKPSELIIALEKDFDQACSNFKSNLKQFIFATTASLEIIETKIKRQSGMEESLLDVCNRLTSTSNINVLPWHWSFLEEKVLESPFLLRHLQDREEGAHLLNDKFIAKRIERFKSKNERKCKLEYYGGQEEIQWFGISMNWDASRKIYDNVIDNIHSSFNKNQPIAAVIRGEGGSGKSVLLRRLAFDLRKNYTIYWLGSNTEAFMNNEFIYDIKQHPESKYLIILEDWYRNIERASNKPIANKLLNELKKLPNTKLIIGDRIGKKKIYDDYVLYNNLHDLKNTENAVLLTNIFKQMPEWEKSVDANQLKDITKTTLFIALFVFCYGEKDSHERLSERYKRIVKSDYNKFVETGSFWNGLANALHNYSHIYSNYGIMLSMQPILEWACYYSDCSIPMAYRSNINRLVDHPLLKKYVHLQQIETKSSGSIQKLKFHHDTMAEQGWAIKHELINVEFSKNVVNDLIAILRSSKQTFDLSMLYYRLARQKGEEGKRMAREYMTTERPDKNFMAFCFCLNLLKKEEIAKQAARDYLKTKKPYENYAAFSKSLDIIRKEGIAKKAARDYLKTKNPNENYASFSKSLDIVSKEEVAKQAARDYLKTENPNENYAAFSKSLDIIREEEVAKQAARDYLKTKNPNENSAAFSKSLDTIREEEVAKLAARDYLKTKNPNENPAAFSKSLDIIREEEVAKQAARNYLKAENRHENAQAFSKSFNIVRGEAIATSVAKKYLEEYIKIGKSIFIPEVFCSTLDILKDDNISKEAANKYLIESKDPKKLQRPFCKCIKILKEDAEQYVEEILTNYNAESNWNFVFESLKIAGKIEKHQELVNNVVNEVIHNRIENWHQYREVLKIPLLNSYAWLNETKYLIKNWKTQNRNYIYTLTFGYIEFPEKLQNVALDIIKNWKHELSSKSKHKAYFTRYLANIGASSDKKLKKEVIQICKEICSSHLKKPLELTKNLEEWLQKIATTSEFPQWNSKIDN